VYLESRATLNMNGFTIDSEASGVSCHPRRCTILGPGVIRAALWGLETINDRATGTPLLQISNVLIEGSYDGIWAGHWKVVATGVTVKNCLLDGILAKKLRGSDITADDNGEYGIYINGGDLIADNVTANGNGVEGISFFHKVQGSNITANSNGRYGIAGEKIIATGVETKGNAMAGVSSGRTVRLTGLVSMNNGGPGLESRAGTMLVDSTLSDNDTLGDGIDILSTRQPRLSNTSCSRSEGLICEPRSWNCSRTGESWGVCSLD